MGFNGLQGTIIIAVWLQTSNVMCETILTRSKVFHQEDISLLNGTLVSETNTQSILECSAACLRKTNCAEFFSNIPQCKTVHAGAGSINLNMLDEYRYYVSYDGWAAESESPVDLSSECPGIYNPDNATGLQKPVGWDSGCPDFYFSLDNDNGL